MKKTERPITKGEAAQILLSAVSYIQKSGVKVTFKTSQDKLVLFSAIPNIELVTG